MKALIDADVEWEHWPEIREGYYLGPDGQLWSDHSNRLLQGYVGENGYLYYTFKDGSRDYAHRLVAESYIFHTVVEGEQVNHKDYDRLNNNWKNLEWVTSGGNNLHAHQSNTRKKVTSYNHSNSKLTKEQAIEIFKSSQTQNGLAAVYGVSSRTIHDIKHGVKYGWATKEGTCT